MKMTFQNIAPENDLRNYCIWNNIRVILKKELDAIEELLASAGMDQVNKKSYRAIHEFDLTLKGLLRLTSSYLRNMKKWKLSKIKFED